MKLGLGTVQLGLDYGISNAYGKPDPHEAERIINRACGAGIKLYDTAPVYNSEAVLGRHLPVCDEIMIVTKLPHCNADFIGKKEIDFFKTTFENTLKRLGKVRVYGLLAHHCEDLFKRGGHELWKLMVSLKERALVKKIGASIYDEKQVNLLCHNYDPDLIQAPVNILDQRLIVNGCLTRLKKSGIEIHARSVFLQGLLLMDPLKLPAFFDPLKEHLQQYHAYIAEKGYAPLEAALNFVASLSEIDYTLVGVARLAQLEEIIGVFGRSAPDTEMRRFMIAEEKYLNPARWAYQRKW